MDVLSNNCVYEIKIPEGVKSGNGVYYNPVLDLYATIDYIDGVSVWSPVSGKVTAECDLGPDGDLHMLFLPGDRIAISYSEVHHGGTVEIYSLDTDTFDSSELEIKVPFLTYPGALALSPERNILVAGSVGIDSGLCEICMDWENLKVLKTRELCIPEENTDSSSDSEDSDHGIAELCCSPDFKIITARFDEDFEKLSTLSVAKVCFNTEGEDEREGEEKIEIKEQATITYYMLDGEENLIDDITGFVYDGQNLIISNGDKIVLLESITEGSNAHLIASGLKPSRQTRRERVLNLNHKGQLMVCEKKVIKLFEYSCNPRSLQDLCRCCVRKTIPTGYRDAVKGLEIPSTLKEYLLYK